jgi:type VI protein secretion system component Hcp
MSEPNSPDLITTPEELTDADLEQVTGGARAVAEVQNLGANVQQHATASVHDFNITKQLDKSSPNLHIG